MPSESPGTIAQLCHRIWEFEDKLQLLDLEVSGVLVWQACRMHIYYKLAEACGLYEQPHVADQRAWPVISKLWYGIRGITVDNPFFRVKPVDTAIFDHARSMPLVDLTVDIYSYFLCKDLEADGKKFIVFERPFLNEYRKSHTFERRRVGVIDSVASALSNLPWMRLSSHDRALIIQLESEFRGCFGVSLNLWRLFSRQVRRFRIRRLLYGKLLERYRIREVYLVVSYYLAPLIDSCKERGIPVRELQHGVINKYHLGYSFPNRAPGTLRYFPDALLAWGGNWPTTQHLPLDRSQQIEHGFRYFTNNSRKYAHLIKHPKRALIVSQSVHGNSLAAFIRNHIGLLAGWDIRYKLHPSEFNRHAQYHDLQHLAKSLPNFSIVEGGDIHELLAESSAVIGVFSTVLFEALEFNCEVYICPLSGWEYMDELLDCGQVKPFAEFGAGGKP